MSISIDRVNYNFQMKVQLRFNPQSENRSTDDTPRFFLKPVKLLHVEKIGFTSNSRTRGYVKHGNRFWRYKFAEELTDERVEELWGKLITSYPYGYVENDTASFLKYNLDTKYNESFQSHYARYWKNNKNLIKKPTLLHDGTYAEGHPYQHIEFTINEIIKVKIPKGKVPAIPDGISMWSEYSAVETYYQAPEFYSCHEEDINVHVQDQGVADSNGEVEHDLAFYIDTFRKYPITVFSSGGSYNFHLVSGDDLVGGYHWPSGGGYKNWSGYKFSFSTGRDGTWNSFNEYTANVSRFESPKIHTAWYMKVIPKDETHPYYGGVPHSSNFGTYLGYAISGESDQAPELSLVRGHTYTFNQRRYDNAAPVDAECGGATNPSVTCTGYRLGISINAGTNGEEPVLFDLTSGVHYVEGTDFATGAPYAYGETIFKVPYDAPDILYYVSEGSDNTFMGNKLNISDPTPALGNKPGETVRITFNQQVDSGMAYYSPDSGDMGSWLFLKKKCDGQIIDF